VQLQCRCRQKPSLAIYALRRWGCVLAIKRNVFWRKVPNNSTAFWWRERHLLSYYRRSSSILLEDADNSNWHNSIHTWPSNRSAQRTINPLKSIQVLSGPLSCRRCDLWFEVVQAPTDNTWSTATGPRSSPLAYHEAWIEQSSRTGRLGRVRLTANR
jgi:hypothetical protein